MDEIDKNIVAFEAMRIELEKDSLSKWVLFHGTKLIGVFDSFEDAAQDATTKFGSGPYLIRQIGVSSITLPVSAMFRGVNK